MQIETKKGSGEAPDPFFVREYEFREPVPVPSLQRGMYFDSSSFPIMSVWTSSGPSAKRSVRWPE
jgi:hypothetical protein